MILVRTLLLLVAFPLFAGCESVRAFGEDLLKTTDKPTARVKGFSFDEIRSDSLDVIADIEVDNPWVVPLYARQVDFSLESEGKRMLTGTSDAELSVPSRSKSTVPLRVSLPYRELTKNLSGVRLGDVIPFTANFDLAVAGESTAPLTLNLSKSGEVPVPAPPKVSVKQLRWEELGLSRAAGTLDLALENPNSFPVDLSKLNYDLDLGGYRLGSGAIGQPGLSLTPGETGDLALDFDMTPRDLGLAAFSMLQSRETSWSMTGQMELGSPFGPMNLGFDEKGRTSLLR